MMNRICVNCAKSFDTPTTVKVKKDFHSDHEERDEEPVNDICPDCRKDLGMSEGFDDLF